MPGSTATVQLGWKSVGMLELTRRPASTRRTGSPWSGSANNAAHPRAMSRNLNPTFTDIAVAVAPPNHATTITTDSSTGLAPS